MPNKNKIFRNVHHIPVLLEETVECLAPRAGESYLDVTAGMGGHAGAILALTGAEGKMVLIDRDPQAVQVLKSKFKKGTVINQDFLSASRKLFSEGHKFDLILADLGVSSLHFDQSGRGFSFSKSGPLDMRMDPRQELTAGEIVNQWEKDDLTRLLRESGEEPRAKLIAEAIVRNRPFDNTAQLASVIGRVMSGPHRRIHPATKTFQALRIAVNDELKQLEQALPLWIEMLEQGGRIAIISFHSLEDRIVKKAFGEHAKNQYEADLVLITKKPLTASPLEIDINPRARSAKLRAAAKIKNKERN